LIVTLRDRAGKSIVETIETMATENENLIAGARGDWEIVIGFEVHAQVKNAYSFQGKKRPVNPT
jgi:hypothetical protein